MTERAIGIGPSILTANWLKLGDEIRAAEQAGVDYLHLDVMDGRFVPNISFGPLVVEAVRGATSLPLDVHLMIEDPSRYVSQFVDAGADAITVHVEGEIHLNRVVQAISSLGAEACVAINPATPVEALEDIAPFVQRVLIMSINPGFGGQTFIPSALGKISRIRTLLNRVNPAVGIRVDGGVKASNIARIVAAGADSFVIGSALFSPDRPIGEAMAEMQTALNER
jgi:ribulose-phosphate 3-epimerase